MRGAGLARQLDDDAHAAGGGGHEVEDQHRSNRHEHALDDVRAHHREEAADGGVADDHRQGRAHRHFVRDAQEDLQQMAGAFEDRDQIQQAGERDDDARGQAHALAGEAHRQEVRHRQRPPSGREPSHARRHEPPGQPREDHQQHRHGQPRHAVFVALAGMADVAVGAGEGGVEGDAHHHAAQPPASDEIAVGGRAGAQAGAGVQHQQDGVGGEQGRREPVLDQPRHRAVASAPPSARGAQPTKGGRSGGAAQGSGASPAAPWRCRRGG